MKVRNKVKEIICMSCGCNKAEIEVHNDEHDSLGLNAEAELTNGIGVKFGLKGKVLEMTDSGICPSCCHEGLWGAKVIFEDGTELNNEKDDVLGYWMMNDWETEEVKPKPVKPVQKAFDTKALPSYR